MKSLIKGYGRGKNVWIRWSKLCLHLSRVLIPPGPTTEMLHAFLEAFMPAAYGVYHVLFNLSILPIFGQLRVLLSGANCGASHNCPVRRLYNEYARDPLDEKFQNVIQ
jgi:hypothetical protein